MDLFQPAVLVVFHVSVLPPSDHSSLTSWLALSLYPVGGTCWKGFPVDWFLHSKPVCIASALNDHLGKSNDSVSDLSCPFASPCPAPVCMLVTEITVWLCSMIKLVSFNKRPVFYSHHLPRQVEFFLLLMMCCPLSAVFGKMKQTDVKRRKMGRDGGCRKQLNSV